VLGVCTVNGSMLMNYDPDSNIDPVTNSEIHDAIRYLDPDRAHPNERHENEQGEDNGVVICVCLYIAMLVCLGFFWIYLQ
jgi:hypothetical protein